jgi:hypothetical protein
LIVPPKAIAAEAQANGMVVEYVPFSPFRLPMELKLRTVGWEGVSNACYQKPAPGSPSPPSVNVCYEYLAEDSAIPATGNDAGRFHPQRTRWSVSSSTVCHEMGHAMFDVLGIPVFGREEDAADDFAIYISRPTRSRVR